MKYEQLRQTTYQANMLLPEYNLVTLTWGNVSGIDRENGIVAIKPSGIAYKDLSPDKIVILNLNGNIIEGNLKPSSDTPTHLELYKNFKHIGGICHTHSPQATMWAQACREIPIFGTTHADYFHGPIPVTDKLTEDEVKNNYELNTGKAIVRRFHDLDPDSIPAVLVANHGPFVWGPDPIKAVENALVLEQIAGIALGTIMINPNQKPISKALFDKHYLRKHGGDAYYGQD